jgi:hypothetical protein
LLCENSWFVHVNAEVISGLFLFAVFTRASLARNIVCRSAYFSGPPASARRLFADQHRNANSDRNANTKAYGR